jgi:hypothetical protein
MSQDADQAARACLVFRPASDATRDLGIGFEIIVTGLMRLLHVYHCIGQESATFICIYTLQRSRPRCGASAILQTAHHKFRKSVELNI